MRYGGLDYLLLDRNPLPVSKIMDVKLNLFMTIFRTCEYCQLLLCKLALPASDTAVWQVAWLNSLQNTECSVALVEAACNCFQITMWDGFCAL